MKTLAHIVTISSCVGLLLTVPTTEKGYTAFGKDIYKEVIPATCDKQILELQRKNLVEAVSILVYG